MGVRGLLPFLRKTHPGVLRKVNVLDYAGKTLALDSTLWVNGCYFSAYDKRQGLHRWHDLLSRLRLNDIEAVCIFDGPGRPKQKYLTTRLRASLRQTAGGRYEVEREVGRHLATLSDAQSLPVRDKQIAFTAALQQLHQTLVDASPAITASLPSIEIPPEAPQVVIAPIEQPSVRIHQPPVAPIAVDTPLVEVPPLPALHREHKKLVAFIEPLIAEDTIVQEAKLPDLEAELSRLGWQSEDRIVRFGRAAHTMPSEFTEACIEMARAYGFPVYSPPRDVLREGEELAASFVLHGRADAVASRDTDVIVHGATLIDGLASNLGRADEQSLLVADPHDIRNVLGLDEAAFIDWCILCGTDYPGHLNGIGPKRALSLLKRHGSIEDMLPALVLARSPSMKYIDVDSYLEDLQGVRRLFLDRAPPPSDFDDLSCGDPDWGKIDELLERFDRVEDEDNPLAYTRRDIGWSEDDVVVNEEWLSS